MLECYNLFSLKCFIDFPNKFSYFHKCCMVVDQILFWTVWLSPIKIEICICIYKFFINLKESNTKIYILQECWNCKPRLNRYDFYVKGFQCDILVITKRCVFLKKLTNLKKLSKVRIILIETHDYEARINSNEKLACFRETCKFTCTYRPSPWKNLYGLKLL